MATSTLFFVIIGVCVVTASLMRLVEWLDTPRPAPHRGSRRVDGNSRVVDFPSAELGLERARHAA